MSRKYIIIIAFLSLITLHALALDVRNTAGMLSQNVKDLDVTSLTVTGSINASDLYFISGNLHLLTSLDLSGVEVTSCTTTERHYLQQIFAANELPVACLADMGLTSVKLPSGLLTIGRAAFAGCDKLAEITLPANLDSIADFAFAGCESIKAVTIPAKVETVGCGAFMRCSALTDFTVESSSHLRRLDAAALMDCPSLTNVSLGASIRSMGERSLAGTGLKTLDLSGNKNLAELGDWVMVETPVTKVVLPANVTSLGDGAFLYDKSLASIRLSDKLTTLNDYLLAGTGLTGTLSISGTESMGDYVMYNADKLSVVELPATLTWLGTRAMAGMTGMKALTSNAVEVPALGSNVWAGVKQSRIPLTVPEESKELYQAANQWKNFMLDDAGWVLGDVNGDGEVNIADVNAIVSIILGHPADDDWMRRADVNEDGEVNVADINADIAIILGVKMMNAEVNTDDLLQLDDLSIMPGEQRTLGVKLNRAQRYNALQCDIVLPNGLTLVKAEAVKNHVSETCQMDAATSRTMTYSPRKQMFGNGEDEVVLYITVRAEATLESESHLTLTNIVLSDNDNVAWHLADCVARVTSTSGVNDLMTNTARVWTEGRYLCVDCRDAGVAQVASINGVTRDLSLDAGVNRYAMEPGFYVVVVDGKSYKIAIK